MVKVTFKCKRSGNLVSFSSEDDIRGLRSHEGYEEVVTPKEVITNKPEVKSVTIEEVKPIKKMGRPVKK